MSSTDPRPGIDPRGPRFGAAITAVLLAVIVFTGLIGATTVAVVLYLLATALFAWGAFAGIRRHPWGLLFATFVRPRLAPAAELEDPRPPTFAQGIGFFVTVAGLALHLLVGPGALVAAASVAFVAAFLNAVFGYCIGCQVYLLLARAGLLGRRPATP
ncbi:MAG: DUF4395 domain-containing protein [Mycetocola sp.]